MLGSFMKKALVGSMLVVCLGVLVGCVQQPAPEGRPAPAAEQPAATKAPAAQQPAPAPAAEQKSPAAAKPAAEQLVPPPAKPAVPPPAAPKPPDAKPAADASPATEIKSVTPPKPVPPKSSAPADNEEAWKKFAKEACVQYGLSEAQTKTADDALQACLKRAAAAREKHKVALLAADQAKDAAARTKADGDLQTALDKLSDECVGRIDALASVVQINKAAKAGFESPAMKNQPPKPEVGFPAPAFELKNADNKAISLESLRGKVVVLHFWATWCGFCKRSMPDMQKFHETIKDKSDVVLYGIVCRQRPDNPEPVAFAKEQGSMWGQLLNGDAASTAYEVQGFPTLYVIGPDGKVIYKERGVKAEVASRLEPIIKRALDEYAKQAKS